MRSRTRDPLLPFAVITLVFAAVFLLYSCIAHADATPVTGTSSAGWDLQTWIVLGMAALGGVKVIIDAVLAFFKVEAPLTKTTVDDRIRDDLQAAHDKLDQLAKSVNGLVDLAKPPGGIRVISGGAVMLAILVLGLAGAMTGCAATTSTVKSEAVTLEGCSAADAQAIVSASAKIVADVKATDRVAAAIDTIGQLAVIHAAWSHCKGAAAPTVAPAPSPTQAPAT